MRTQIRIGTRRSQLALYQAELARAKILHNFPSLQVELVKITTSGDMVRRGKASPLESKRFFTREIEDALLKGEVDLAVHSAKDLAVLLPDGLKVGAVLEREDPRDCLVSLKAKSLSEFASGARVGTSSLRRKKQILRLRPDLNLEEMRGNVDTRIRKVEAGLLDGVVLAYAGLKRLGLVNHVVEVFDENQFYPAPGQGAIIVEARAADPEIDSILSAVGHEDTQRRVDCEREFLKTLQGGCQLPCGITTHLAGARIKAAGALFSLGGDSVVEDIAEGPSEKPAELGRQLAEKILGKGGREILEEIRRETAKN